jgi:glucosylceramidase
VTPQNEIDADQGGRMPTCPWAQEDEERLVVALGPLLEASGTKIWMLDHNYTLWGRVLDQLSNPRFKKYVNTVAWHGYLGAPEMMRNVKENFPDVEMDWTEGGDDYKFPDYWTSWCKWGATFSGILANGPQCITTWNLALDERGRPNIGPFDCGGLVQIHSVTKEIKEAGLLGVGALRPRVSPRRCDCRLARRQRRRSGGKRGTGRSARTISNWDGNPV